MGQSDYNMCVGTSRIFNTSATTYSWTPQNKKTGEEGESRYILYLPKMDNIYKVNEKGDLLVNVKVLHMKNYNSWRRNKRAKMKSDNRLVYLMQIGNETTIGMHSRYLNNVPVFSSGKAYLSILDANGKKCEVGPIKVDKYNSKRQKIVMHPFYDIYCSKCDKKMVEIRKRVLSQK